MPCCALEARGTDESEDANHGRSGWLPKGTDQGVSHHLDSSSEVFVMSMKVLNRLIARSIMDPTVVPSFEEGRFEGILSDAGFSQEVLEKLSAVEADSWKEFTEISYQTIRDLEMPRMAVELPSPAEGLYVETGLLQAA